MVNSVPPPTPVDQVIDLVRQLEAARQEYDALSAKASALNEHMLALRAKLQNLVRVPGLDAPSTDVAEEQPRPGSKAARILDMVREGRFTIGGACTELYPRLGDVPETRKNVRSILRYLEERLNLIRRLDGQDHWEVVA